MAITVDELTELVNTWSFYPALLSVVFLIRYYQITKLRQYLIMVVPLLIYVIHFKFISGNYSVMGPDNPKWFMIYKLNEEFIAQFLLWYYAASIRWHKIPRKWIYANLIYGISLFILTLFIGLYQVPEQSNYLIFNARPFLGYIGLGGTNQWGVTTNSGTILYYAGFATNSFYRIIINFSMAYIFLTMDHPSNNKKLKLGKYSWGLHFILYTFVSAAILLYELFYVDLSIDTFLLFILFVGIGNLIEPLIIIFFPEIVMLNHHQMAKVQTLYSSIQESTKTHSSLDIGYSLVQNYLQSIPQSVMTQIRDEAAS